MIRQVDGHKLKLYEFSCYLSDYIRDTGAKFGLASVSEELAREAVADHYDYFGIYGKRPKGIRYPEKHQVAERIQEKDIGAYYARK